MTSVATEFLSTVSQFVFFGFVLSSFVFSIWYFFRRIVRI